MHAMFRPTSFINALKEEISRSHKNEKAKWWMEELQMKTIVKLKDMEIKEEGVFVSGLWLEGGKLNALGMLEDQSH